MKSAGFNGQLTIITIQSGHDHESMKAADFNGQLREIPSDHVMRV